MCSACQTDVHLRAKSHSQQAKELYEAGEKKILLYSSFLILFQIRRLCNECLYKVKEKKKLWLQNQPNIKMKRWSFHFVIPFYFWLRTNINHRSEIKGPNFNLGMYFFFFLKTLYTGATLQISRDTRRMGSVAILTINISLRLPFESGHCFVCDELPVASIDEPD